MTPEQTSKKLATLARGEAREQFAQIAQGLISVDEAIGGLANRGAIFGIAALVAERAALPIDDVVAALVAASDEPLLVMCRASGVRPEAYSAVLRMRRRRLSRAEDSPAEALAAYRRLPQDIAKRLLPLVRLDRPEASCE